MKSITTLAAVALLGLASVASAQQADPCADKLKANAAVISKAQAEKDAVARKKIIQKAIDADPKNAVCLVDLALQMGLTGIEPAAGPDEGGAGPDFNDGTTPPTENPNQLNQGTGGSPASPAAPAAPAPVNLPNNS